MPALSQLATLHVLSLDPASDEPNTSPSESDRQQCACAFFLLCFASSATIFRGANQRGLKTRMGRSGYSREKRTPVKEMASAILSVALGGGVVDILRVAKDVSFIFPPYYKSPFSASMKYINYPRSYRQRLPKTSQRL